MAEESSQWLVDTLGSLTPFLATDSASIKRASSLLLASFRRSLKSSAETMLPSYTTALPTTDLSGRAVAIDLGGSTLRVAVILLCPHIRVPGDDGSRLGDMRKVISRGSWLVDDRTKSLPGRDFFDWIAKRVGDVMEHAELGNGQGEAVGVTWSFPVTQTSVASGVVQQMGKGYSQWKEIAGTDLREHFEAGFRRQGLNLRMKALMNDTEATLVSHAFANPATKISLILGTGLNAAIPLPLSCLSEQKLGKRPKQWMKTAKLVLVNTEVSMFGREIFPLSKADQELDAASTHPGFQPLEQVTSGRYLGEICRLVIVDGVRRGQLFAGMMPDGLDAKFGLDTALMAILEEQPLGEATSALSLAFKFANRPSQEDVRKIRDICRAVSNRAALYIAITVYTLWRLQRDTLLADPVMSTELRKESGAVAVAYCGAVMEKHPTIRQKSQDILDFLVDTEAKTVLPRRLVFEGASDSGLLGAAVGAVMNTTNGIIDLQAKL